MKSLWKETGGRRKAPRLEGDVQTDVLVIGGGMAGVLCAFYISQAGIPCILVEAHEIGCGVTGGTTAKITVQHGLLYDKLICRFGEETARSYLSIQQRALEQYRELCAGIDCEFEEKTSFVYSLDDRGTIEREVRALRRLGADADFSDTLPFPFPVAGSVFIAGQAQFHPLKFLNALAEKITVYEDTPVRRLEGTTAYTDFGRIFAKKVIVATHFPFLNRHGSYFLKLYQHRSYALALEGAPVPDGMYVDESGHGLSFRGSSGLLLLGGGGHRTGKKGGGWAVLQDFVKKAYPMAREKYRWATQDCMSLDAVPYIGPYSKHTPNVYVATGFNKWGMTSSMISAMLLKEMVQGREHPCAHVFSPSRTILRPQLAVNGVSSLVSLLTPSARRCPHMGCALKWNPQEHTWDCPCHGSRFTKEGLLLDNPATDDLPH